MPQSIDGISPSPPSSKRDKHRDGKLGRGRQRQREREREMLKRERERARGEQRQTEKEAQKDTCCRHGARERGDRERHIEDERETERG